MGAVVQILSYYGSGPSSRDITNQEIAYKQTDTDSVTLADAIDVPASGKEYSWAKFMKLNVVSGLTGQIGFIRWFAEDAPEDWVQSVEAYAGLKSSYTQPSSSDEAGQISSTNNIDTYTAASPLVVTAVANSITSTGTGTQQFVCRQMAVLSTATAGMKTLRKVVYRYNET
jgi:hypothetical protein